ncbi:YihY/virulence factor BrkB family protein [Haloglycomyces albus]|uniref:YihY/virulence factor BrkB family protein n=1 Tax=Haloglycomyces albus TaxID=526067 RepID=UPI00046CD78F|nr:YihY/virulence factor BrkB family protein [Haloglycomyces albus]
MKTPDLGAWFDAYVERVRKRSPFADHSWRSGERFAATDGGLLSASIAYYAFFASFSMSLLALAVFGYLLHVPAIYQAVESWLAQNLPIVDIGLLEESRQQVGILAVVALIVAGVAWVQAVRNSVRHVWGLERAPGNPFLRWFIDLGVLAGLSVLLLLTIAASAGFHTIVGWLSLDSVIDSPSLLSVLSLATALITDMVLAMVMLIALPRMSMSLRRVLPAALMVAVGLEGLKTIGRLFISNVSDRPAYQAVSTAVGLLLFFYLFNFVLLFAAAWTATSRHGQVRDLYNGRFIPNS